MPPQVDYARLAREHGGQAASPSPAPAVDYAALASELGGASAAGMPTFRSQNATDAQGRPVVRPDEDGAGWIDQVSDYFTTTIRDLNPFPMLHRANTSVARGIQYGLAGQPIEGAKSIGRDALGVVEGLGVAAGQLRQDAADAFAQGDYVTGSRKLINYLLTGLGVGPALDEASDLLEQGQYGKGLGKATAVGLQAGVPVAGSRVSSIRVPRPLRNRVPEVQDAVEFGIREGIPVDAATASGNPFIRATQKVADESLAGSVVGERAKLAQAEGFTQAGERLMTRAHPQAVTAEQAGQGLKDATLGTVRRHAGEADAAYTKLRDMEGNYYYGDYVPVDLPAPVKIKMREQVGEVPSAAVIQEMRRIREELDAVPFQPGKLIEDRVKGTSTYSYRAPGAPVYDDILQAAPGTSNMTRAEVQASIDKALRTGTFTNAARGALDVARRRLAAAGGRYDDLSSPILPPDAGQVTQAMLMPVDLTAAKAGLQPLYDRLLRESQLVPLQGGKARALTALDRLMTSPDHAPLSVVDAALGEIKAMARADVPELRTAAQGAAAKAVRELDGAVRSAAAKAGPEVLETLEKGRAATTAKYVTAEILESLRDEPVGAFRQATAPRDAGIGLLRDLQRVAPDELPKVGRAVLEDLLSTATAEGGFNRAQGLFAKWQQLGSATKQLLYRDPGLVKDLDRFFLLAKRAAENPNPSGSALTVLKFGEGGLYFTNPVAGLATSITAGMLSKLLHSPKAVAVLNRGLTIPLGKSPAAVSALVNELTVAAREAGAPLAAVGAEDRRSSEGSGRRPRP